MTDENGDIDRQIAALEKEIQELDARIQVLGDRLAAGDNAVRAELNPAMRRSRELGQQRFALELASGRVSADQTMYGPPWMFQGEAGPSMSEPQDLDANQASGRTGFWSRLTARLFGRR